MCLCIYIYCLNCCKHVADTSDGRFEPDMLAFSWCYYGGGEKERYELGEIRKRWATLPVRLLSFFYFWIYLCFIHLNKRMMMSLFNMTISAFCVYSEYTCNAYLLRRSVEYFASKDSTVCSTFL